jgi:hypothetical protein
MVDIVEFSDLLRRTKELAKQYRLMTGRPLGVTGEVAEYEAARLLGLTLAPARQAGYDAVEIAEGKTRKLQIKGRCLTAQSKPGQRIGSIDIAKEWDAVLLVLLDEDLEATAIYEAQRDAVLSAILTPGSKARNERWSLGVGKFRSIAICRWSR